MFETVNNWSFSSVEMKKKAKTSLFERYNIIVLEAWMNFLFRQDPTWNAPQITGSISFLVYHNLSLIHILWNLFCFKTRSSKAKRHTYCQVWVRFVIHTGHFEGENEFQQLHRRKNTQKRLVLSHFKTKGVFHHSQSENLLCVVIHN